LKQDKKFEKGLGLSMNITKQIKTLLQEGELYHSQGLLDEALLKYHHAADLIERHELLKNRLKLLDAVSKKIQRLKDEIQRIEKAPKKPEVSPKIQDLIKRLFTFTPNLNEDARALEGAVALAKFGQFKRAILEFKGLLKKDSLRVAAAKNIIRCHMALSSLDDAVAEYEQWLSENIFLPNQLQRVRTFFENVVEKEGLDIILPQTQMTPDDVEPFIHIPEIHDNKDRISDDDRLIIEDLKVEDHEDLDINSIGITFDRGPLKDQVFEFKVRFQLGNVVSLLISGREKDLIENFKVGTTINDVQYYSNIALFNGSGLITAVKKIKIGPLLGDYCVDIEAAIG
jgi:tetratricopeptide (TPR) repeat protein